VGIVEVHKQAAGQLRQRRFGRVRGDDQDVHSAGGVFDDEERVGRCRVIVSRWNRSQARMPGRERRESGPGRTSPPRRGIDARCLIVAGDLGPRARNGLHRATPPIPENTVNSVKRDVAAAQERIKR
jgi:hypothetical protein